MSAQTIHELDLTTQALTRPRLPQQRTVPSHLALVPELAPRRGPAPGRAVRVTRRGRLVLTFALMAVAAVLAFSVAGRFGGADAAPASSSVPIRTVVVQPGQTLWSIAAQVAPSADRGTTIARLVQLNRLPSTDVAAGVRLVVPAR